MKKILISLMLTSLSMFAIAQDKVTIDSKAFVEIKKTVDGKEKKTLEPAVSVLPGQTVVFKNTVDNKNKTTVQDIAVTNAIPKDISFYSVFSDDEKNTEYQYSIDGKEFKTANQLYTKDPKTGESRLARPEEYTAIRWIYKSNFPASSKLDFGYKGILK
jgi:uncharacterized repeat protein (TIGR01451 family)